MTVSRAQRGPDETETLLQDPAKVKPRDKLGGKKRPKWLSDVAPLVQVISILEMK